MSNLYEMLKIKVYEWRTKDYAHAEYSSIAEILEWAGNPEGSGFRLRPPQQRALETYWYLRLIEGTPHIIDLYKRLFLQQSDLLGALGLKHEDIKTFVLDHGTDAVIQRIQADDLFVRQFRLQALRETLTLSYPSYILALAMGAGKTALIGAIIATESMQWPQITLKGRLCRMLLCLPLVQPLSSHCGNWQRFPMNGSCLRASIRGLQLP